MAGKRGPDEGPGAFGRWLQKVEKGDLDTRLMGELRALVAAVEQNQRKGVLTLTLEVSPATRGKVRVAGIVGLKEPKPITEDTLFYVAAGCDLVTRDPAQLVAEELLGYEPADSAGERKD